MSGSVWSIRDLQMWIHLYKEKQLLQLQEKMQNQAVGGDENILSAQQCD